MLLRGHYLEGFSFRYFTVFSLSLITRMPLSRSVFYYVYPSNYLSLFDKY